MIRQLLQKKFNDDRYRHIPKIEESEIEGIKMEYADGKKLTDVLDDFSVEDFLRFMKKSQLRQ